MTPPSHLDDTLLCEPLTLGQSRLLVGTSPVPMMVADVSGEGFSVLAVDPLLRRLITGARHPAGPMPGEVIAPEGFGALAGVLQDAVARPEDRHLIEIPIGDEPLWFEVNAAGIGDESGCRQVVLLAADRTADHDIEQRQRRSARRFQAMVTHAPGLILLVDSAGRILRCSPAVDRLLGVQADELVGRAVFELLHPDTLARAASIFNQVLSSPGEPLAIADFRMSHGSGAPLWCEATVTNLLHDDDVAAIVFNAHDVTDRRIAEQRLELAATSDSLTGLANRRRLEQRLRDSFEAAARDDAGVGLVVVDIDDFKLVNDGLGHDVGDAVLRALANRLEALVGDRGHAARIGGDEFALVLERIVDPGDIDRLADGVHEVLRSPVNALGQDVYTRGSVGTATGRPETADADSLLRAADLALYRAKRNGRNQTVRFAAELQLEAETRLETITSLQRALRDGRLRLAYQPVVGLEGELVGAEALLRWEHDGELLSPARFIQLAEDTGLILPIGAWVLEQVCRDLTALRTSSPDLQWLSINMSSRQLLDERLPDLVARTVQGHDIAPGSIAFEIDESTIRSGGERVRTVLGRLDQARVMLATDDLGVDQDILALIGELPIAAVKLDRRFVQQLDLDQDGHHRAIATAAVQHAAEHGVEVIAEGVESEEQRRVLEDAGCGRFQGFHISEPLDLGSFLTRTGRRSG
ncbi:MAG: EAL domain-containing protein [Actinomycetota bacterium]